MNGEDSYPPPEFSPRLSCLEKWPDYQGYGFNLHAERGKAGQFIGKVDDGSPAEAAKLKLGDKIVEVNGINVLNQNHHQVVTLIREGGDKVDLLVVDKETEEYYRSNSLVIKGTAPNVIKYNSHRHQNGAVNGNVTEATQEVEVIKKAETVVAVESVPVHRTLRTPTPPPEPENDYNDVPDDIIPPPVIDQTDSFEEEVVVKAKTKEVHAEPTNGTDHIVATPPRTPDHTHAPAEPVSDTKKEDLSFGMSAREYREMMKNKQSKEAARKNALGFKEKKDAFDQL